MKVLFVYSFDDAQSLWRPMRSLEYVQLGISYISSVLKERGHETRLTVLGSEFGHRNRRVVDAVMKSFGPSLVLFTAVASQYPFIAAIATYIKSCRPDAFLVIGGPHASLSPDAVIADAFDALCVGEGELPMVELADQLEKGHSPSKIANLWIKRQDRSIEKNPPRPFLQDLNALPFPDREMWHPWIEEEVGARLSVLLGRGCPFDCTYCCNHALKRLAPGKYVRMRSPENIVEELAFLRRRYPQKRHVHLEVETIGIHKTWAMELCDAIEALNSTANPPFSFSTNFRISRQALDENLFMALKRANIVAMTIGLESGSERIRREVLHRNYSNEDFLQTVSLARRHGIKLGLFNMVGIPGETMADYLETVRLNRQCQPDWTYNSIFFPYPGTALHKLCLEQQLLDVDLDTHMERRRAVLNLPAFPRVQIQRAHTWFDYRVFRGHRPRWELLLNTLVCRLKANARANYMFRFVMRLPVIRGIRSAYTRRGLLG